MLEFEIILEIILESDILEASLLIISEEFIEIEIVIEEVELTEAFETISTLDKFKSWAKMAFDLTNYTVNTVIGLQFMYKMVYTHYHKTISSRKKISLSQALLDIEATFKKEFNALIELAYKEINSEHFHKLPNDVQNRIKQIPKMTPAQYWNDEKLEMLKSLKKLPIYHI